MNQIDRKLKDAGVAANWFELRGLHLQKAFSMLRPQGPHPPEERGNLPDPLPPTAASWVLTCSVTTPVRRSIFFATILGRDHTQNSPPSLDGEVGSWLLARAGQNG